MLRLADNPVHTGSAINLGTSVTRCRQRPPYGAERMADDIVVQALDTCRLVHARVTANPRLSAAHPLTESHRLRDAADIGEFIAHAWDATTGLLNTMTVNASAAEVSDLVTVLSRLRNLETALAEKERALTSTLSDVTTDALSRLSQCANAAELMAMIPAQAARLGFDRVLFSTVSSGRWYPKSAYSRCGSEWASPYLDGENRSGFLLPSAAAHCRAAHVNEATMLAHRERAFGFSLWQRSKSRDFWMVPVLFQHRIAGIIHADCHLQERIPSKSEIDALRRFCLQLSVLIARFAAVSAPSVERDVHSTGGLASVSVFGQLTAIGVRDPADVDFAAEWGLSAREVEVIALMAEGLTNAQIGRRLTIAEGTVKSHVKRILRKTSSSNRAETVAMWMKPQRLVAG
ncbi:LuxR C-terminal-related transcriptional regulator [Rhodococcus sp. USK13]|uniref:helix-turn-helix transcriptional regulator n=1 Tax=Rhodococcus sp. USK13 TaxID=2806442 RepID=UPI001BCC1789|nr:LuxR C-terminal-related transcriptional regulator [Rhodococcus sp. USK13]